MISEKIKILEKYASLLVNYCLEVKQNEQILISSTYLAEPLIKEVVKEIYKAGGHPALNIELNLGNVSVLEYGNKHQLEWLNPMKKLAFQTFDAYLNIRAPFARIDDEPANADAEKYNIYQQAQQELSRIYFERIGNGSMKRCLCQYPTPAAAENAQMTLEEYEKFVFQSCFLFEENPVEKWLDIRRQQQVYVERLNKADQVHYKGPNIDITFSVKGRKWINSDGRANMPSGEVFSAPVEDSVNGRAYFSYPTIYMGKDVEGISVEVVNGEIVYWDAQKGKDILDKVFSIPGARRWGEVAIGTNYHISCATRNILFDEKIGGSIHMAIGQSYRQCGGKNESSVHWDMITDMKNGGQIFADGELIYENGKFLI